MEFEARQGTNQSEAGLQDLESDGFLQDSLLQDQGFPLGYFTISPEDDRVRFNRRMAAILRIEELRQEPLQVGDFWKRIERMSGDPQATREEINQGLENIHQQPVLEIDLAQAQAGLKLLIYPIEGDGSSRGKIAGLAFDQAYLKNSYEAYSGMLKDLALQSRKSSATVQGKMEALRENLEIWPQAIQTEFLQEMLSGLDILHAALDLTLNLVSSLDSLNVFAERTDLAALTEKVIADLENPDILFKSEIRKEGRAPLALVDPALTRLGLVYMLEEIQDIGMPGKLEVSLSRDEGSLVLALHSPRSLALPGMGPLGGGVPAEEENVRLYLARRMVSVQGGQIHVDRISDQEGVIQRISISFPEQDNLERSDPVDRASASSSREEGRVLLALAHADQQISLRNLFLEEGYRVDLVVDGNSAIDLAQRNTPDLVIISRNLPGLDGLLVTQGIRRWSAMPIILISERTNLDDLTYAYQLGVDDYLRAPFAREELLARARVCIRRSAAAKRPISPDIYQSNHVKIDYALQKVWIRGMIVALTPIEYNLLVYMSRHANQIIPYEQLLENVWEGPEKGTRQGLFVHIKRLREKIELDPKNPQIVTNKWGIGYIFSG